MRRESKASNQYKKFKFKKKKQSKFLCEFMAVTRDEAAAMGGEGQARNPVPNDNANPNPNPNANPNSPHSTTRGSKGKSCKGCAYYSSVHKAKSKNPTCVGFSRTLQQGLSLYLFATL